MILIGEFMTDDHRKCDSVFSEAENSILNKEYEGIEQKVERLITDMLNHFKMEEEVMFPKIEERIGMSEGPTEVMRMEHNQIRQIMLQMQEAIKTSNWEQFLGLADSFMILVQQHNAKEEQILYSMADNVLSDIKDEIIDSMKKITEDDE